MPRDPSSSDLDVYRSGLRRAYLDSLLELMSAIIGDQSSRAARENIYYTSENLALGKCLLAAAHRYDCVGIAIRGDEPRAHRAQVDMRAGRLTRHGLVKCEIGDLVSSEIIA